MKSITKPSTTPLNYPPSAPTASKVRFAAFKNLCFDKSSSYLQHLPFHQVESYIAALGFLWWNGVISSRGLAVYVQVHYESVWDEVCRVLHAMYPFLLWKVKKTSSSAESPRYRQAKAPTESKQDDKRDQYGSSSTTCYVLASNDNAQFTLKKQFVDFLSNLFSVASRTGYTTQRIPDAVFNLSSALRYAFWRYPEMMMERIGRDKTVGLISVGTAEGAAALHLFLSYIGYNSINVSARHLGSVKEYYYLTFARVNNADSQTPVVLELNDIGYLRRVKHTKDCVSSERQLATKESFSIATFESICAGIGPGFLDFILPEFLANEDHHPNRAAASSAATLPMLSSQTTTNKQQRRQKKKKANNHLKSPEQQRPKSILQKQRDSPLSPTTETVTTTATIPTVTLATAQAPTKVCRSPLVSPKRQPSPSPPASASLAQGTFLHC
jgi:hypothetical protein